MSEAERKQILIESILAKFDKLQELREAKAEQGISLVPLSKGDSP